MSRFIVNDEGKIVDTETGSVFACLQEVVLKLNQQNQVAKQLKQRLFIDELTQTYTRAFLDEAEPSYKNKPCFVSFVDSNRLKQVNDGQGHLAGDEYLRTIARTLKKFGKVVRYGGDEFIVISESHPKGLTSTYEFSAGTVFKPVGMDLDQAIQLADQKMFEEKKQMQAQTFTRKNKKDDLCF